MVWVVIVAVVVVAVVITFALKLRSRADPVDSFRRQIDALSPEARRPTIDQVRRVDDDSDDTGQNGS